MKKILFVLPHMLCGGVEKSLLAILDVFKDEFDITVCMVKQEGDFIDLIPKEINKMEIPLEKRTRNQLMLGGIKASAGYYIKKRQILNFLKLAYNIITFDSIPTLLIPFEKIGDIKEEFDIAVCFHMHMPFCVRYVAEKVTARYKYIWVHNDFLSSGFNVGMIKKYLCAYEKIFVVTEQLKDEFLRLCPEYNNKIKIFHNLVSEETIVRMAEQANAIEMKHDRQLKFLTMGRLDKQKGYDLVLDVCCELRKTDLQFTWYILGNGALEEHLKKRIRKEKLENVVKLLGIRKNPYPYLKECDIYIQPSKHEGYGIAVAEARALHKPIICTNFTGAKDQIKDFITGRIVTYSVDDLCDAIIDIAHSPQLRTRFCINLSYEKVDSVDEINLLRSFFNQ